MRGSGGSGIGSGVGRWRRGDGGVERVEWADRRSRLDKRMFVCLQELIPCW